MRLCLLCKPLHEKHTSPNQRTNGTPKPYWHDRFPAWPGRQQTDPSTFNARSSRFHSRYWATKKSTYHQTKLNEDAVAVRPTSTKFYSCDTRETISVKNNLLLVRHGRFLHHTNCEKESGKLPENRQSGRIANVRFGYWGIDHSAQAHTIQVDLSCCWLLSRSRGLAQACVTLCVEWDVLPCMCVEWDRCTHSDRCNWQCCRITCDTHTSPFLSKNLVLKDLLK